MRVRVVRISVWEIENCAHAKRVNLHATICARSAVIFS